MCNLAAALKFNSELMWKSIIWTTFPSDKAILFDKKVRNIWLIEYCQSRLRREANWRKAYKSESHYLIN